LSLCFLLDIVPTRCESGSGRSDHHQNQVLVLGT
jgi:hypothetical protein